MKKIVLFLTVMACSISYSQNNLPTSGPVTIGNSGIASGCALDVHGRVMIGSSLVINDSLVVDAVHARDKLTVDKKAVFKEDAIVKQDLRVKDNIRVDSNLRVDGIAKLNGDVKMTNLGLYNGAFNNIEMMIVKDNGQVKKVTFSELLEVIKYNNVPFTCDTDSNGNIPNASWLSGLNKVYVCPGVNVGVGTNNPVHKVHVSGVTYSKKILTGYSNATTNAIINGFVTGNNTPIMELGKLQVSQGAPSVLETLFKITNSGATEINNTGSDNSLTINSGSGTALVINNGSGHAFVINSNNGSKILQLEDNGTLRSRHIKVDLDAWADYVFSDDYELMSLKETEKFIQAKGHLPGVPSAKTIKSDGLDLGEMQNIQMEKIEELYLHVIEMEKKIDALEEKNSYLKSELHNLKKNEN